MLGAAWMMMSILGGPQMDAINAWCSLDECCEFLEVPRWMLLMPGAPSMNVVNSWRSPDGCY